MSSSALTIPDNFKKILSDFMREVLRNQPENIYDFGYKYFTHLSFALDKLKPPSRPRTVFAQSALTEFEKTNSPSLPLSQIRRILSISDPTLAYHELLYILSFSSSFLDERGYVEWSSFLPEADEAYHTLRDAESDDDDDPHPDLDFDCEVPARLHGFDQRMLEETLFRKQILGRADVTQDGWISTRAFLRALRQNDYLRLSEREVCVIWAELGEFVERDGAGAGAGERESQSVGRIRWGNQVGKLFGLLGWCWRFEKIDAERRERRGDVE